MGLFGKYRLLLVDLDGVVWRGGRIIERNVAFLRAAHREGVKLVFITNNATRSRRLYAEKLTSILGFIVPVDDVFTSGYATAIWLRENYGSSRVLAIGEEGLIEELSKQGHLVVNAMDPIRCPLDFVVVGLDRTATYTKLAKAHRAIVECGAKLVACNSDNTIPASSGSEPGAGALLAFLEASTGVNPVAVIGKPNTYMVELVLKEKKVPRSSALVIGDRCDTDIEAARRAGLDSVLVLTGVAGEKGEMCDATYIVKDLLELSRQHT